MPNGEGENTMDGDNNPDQDNNRDYESEIREAQTVEDLFRVLKDLPKNVQGSEKDYSGEELISRFIDVINEPDANVYIITRSLGLREKASELYDPEDDKRSMVDWMLLEAKGFKLGSMTLGPPVEDWPMGEEWHSLMTKKEAAKQTGRMTRIPMSMMSYVEKVLSVAAQAE